MLRLAKEGKGAFSKEAREKVDQARRERAKQQRLKNPLHSLPHLKVVYLHYHPRTREYFWCGHGNWRRPRKTGNRSNLWKEYVRKHGKEWEVIIVQSGLEQDVAWWLEKSLTQQIGTIHNQRGSLLNHDGRHGRGRAKQSEEFKQKVRESITSWHAKRKAAAKLTRTGDQ